MAIPDGFAGYASEVKTPLIEEDYLREGAELASKAVEKAETTLANRRDAAANAREVKKAKAAPEEESF